MGALAQEADPLSNAAHSRESTRIVGAATRMFGAAGREVALRATVRAFRPWLHVLERDASSRSWPLATLSLIEISVREEPSAPGAWFPWEGADYPLTYQNGLHYAISMLWKAAMNGQGRPGLPRGCALCVEALLGTQVDIEWHRANPETTIFHTVAGDTGVHGEHFEEIRRLLNAPDTGAIFRNGWLNVLADVEELTRERGDLSGRPGG